MILAAIERSVSPQHEGDGALEAPCVRDAVTDKGVMYAEAVGFNPMPAAAITCTSPQWLARVGQAPPPAPTEGILLIGFDDERHGHRQFNARVERPDWRKFPGHFSNYGCGSARGTVQRENGRWIARVLPEDAP